MRSDGGRGAMLRLVEDGVAGLGHAGIDGVGPADLASYVRKLRGFIDQLELLSARAVGALERVGGYSATGAADVVSWLASECKLSPEAATDRVVLARQLGQLGPTVDRLAGGELSFEQAAVVARNTSKVRPEDAPLVEAMILERAGEMNAGRLRQHAQA